MGGWGGGGRENARGGGGGLPCPRDGARSGVCTDLSIAACSLTGGGVVRGRGHVCVRLCRLCGTGRRRKLEKGGTHTCGSGNQRLQDLALQRGAPILPGCEVGGYTHTFSRDSHSGLRVRLLTLARYPPQPLHAQTLRLAAPPHTDAAVCFCWVCQCCLCSRDCVIA